MKRLSLVFAALVAALAIPAVASANGGGHHGPPPPPPNVPVLYAPPITAGSGNATISATSVTCAAGDGSYTVTWTAHITDLSRHNTPTTWALGGTVAAVSDPITVTIGFNVVVGTFKIYFRQFICCNQSLGICLVFK